MRRSRSVFLPVLLTILVAVLLAACQPIQPSPAEAHAGQPEAESLAPDPEVRTGTLENGLTYFVRANQEPENRSELWLVVNAGSTAEDEDQRGLAHFLEHMLFNGTQEYPATELVNFLESIGMEFGPDVNAYTSFDETVYTLQAPTDDRRTLAQGLDVLREWASAALIDPEQVDKERGVVTEEWRMRDLNAGGRVSDEIVEALLGGSRYAERLPIGDMEIIASAPAEALRRFYEAHYRPDNMAIVAVGDFDPAQMESDIRTHFGDLVNPPASRDEHSWSVPDYGATSARVITDPEFPATFVEVAYKLQPASGATVADFRSALVTAATLQILNYRLDDLRRAANPPFLYAGADAGELVRAADQSTIYAQVEDDAAQAGLAAIVAEVERLRQHGVTVAELERAQSDALRGFRQAANESKNIPNSDHAAAMRDYFLTGDVPVSAEEAFRLAQNYLPEITTDEIAARALELFPRENRVVLLIAPERAGVTLPSSEELVAQVSAAESLALEPPAEGAQVGALLEDIPEPAQIVAQHEVPEIGASMLELANGIKVWLKPTEFKDDQVLFLLSSPGGVSVVDDADVVAATFATSVVGESGVGALNQSELQRALTGVDVSVMPYVDATSEGVSASASPKDLETMLQLVYLYATKPRADADALALFQRQVASYLQDRELAPESLLEERLDAILCSGDSPRCNSLAALEQVNTLNIDDALAAYQNRFASLGDATALLVGNFDPDEVIPLLQRYLGSLPAGSTEVAQDLVPALPRQLFDEALNKGIDPTSYVQMVWQGPLTPTVASRVALRALENVLDIRVREVVREEMAAIYGAGVGGSIKSAPENEYSLSIQFTSAPTRALEVVDAVQAIIADVRTNGPSEDVLSRAKQTLLSDHEENLLLNEAWLAWLQRYVVDAEGQATDMLTIQAAIEALTPEDVRLMAERMLTSDARVQLILYPEGYTP